MGARLCIHQMLNSRLLCQPNTNIHMDYSQFLCPSLPVVFVALGDLFHGDLEDSACKNVDNCSFSPTGVILLAHAQVYSTGLKRLSAVVGLCNPCSFENKHAEVVLVAMTAVNGETIAQLPA